MVNPRGPLSRKQGPSPDLKSKIADALLPLLRDHQTLSTILLAAVHALAVYFLYLLAVK
jgi:hypothetical protein